MYKISSPAFHINSGNSTWVIEFNCQRFHFANYVSLIKRRLSFSSFFTGATVYTLANCTDSKKLLDYRKAHDPWKHLRWYQLSETTFKSEKPITITYSIKYLCYFTVYYDLKCVKVETKSVS